MTHTILKTLHRWFPFPLQGGLAGKYLPENSLKLSCLICASNRAQDLDILLQGLSHQTLAKENFEVVIVQDGEKPDVARVISEHAPHLNIVHIPVEHKRANIGIFRNISIAHARGRYCVMLDDDSRIIQKDFLEQSIRLFEDKQVDVIIPRGQAVSCLVKQRYQYFHEYSFGNAGVCYTKAILEELGGFLDDLPSYEDIEFSIRLAIHGAKVIRSDEITYLHPPSYFPTLQKPLSIGTSIFRMRKQYSFPIWLCVYCNSLRFLPLLLIPHPVCRQWGIISLGVLLRTFRKQDYTY